MVPKRITMCVSNIQIDIKKGIVMFPSYTTQLQPLHIEMEWDNNGIYFILRQILAVTRCCKMVLVVHATANNGSPNFIAAEISDIVFDTNIVISPH